MTLNRDAWGSAMLAADADDRFVLDRLLCEAIDHEYALVRVAETAVDHVEVFFEAGIIVRQRPVAPATAAALLSALDRHVHFVAGMLSFTDGAGVHRYVRVDSWPPRGRRGARDVVVHVGGHAPDARLEE